jgi:hypothetical protein
MAVTLKLNSTALADAYASCLSYAEYIESLDERGVVVVRLDLLQGTDVAGILKLAKVGVPFEATFPDGDATLTIKGDVLECSYSFTRTGMWRVWIRGTDKLHRLRANQPPSVWAVTPDSAVGTIAGRYSLSADSPEAVTGSPKVVLQTGTDAAWITTIAEENNFYVRGTADDKIKFGRRKPTGTAIEIVFLDVVDELTMDVSLLEPVTKVTVTAEDYTKSTPELMKFEADSSKLLKISGGDDAATLAKPFARALTLSYHGNWDPKVLEGRAVGELQRLAEKLVKGKIRCPNAKGALSGLPVKITGKAAPWPLTGPFLIRQTRRVFDEGHYYIEIEFVSDSLPAAS